jgi:hypothetical protein
MVVVEKFTLGKRSVDLSVTYLVKENYILSLEGFGNEVMPVYVDVSEFT